MWDLRRILAAWVIITTLASLVLASDAQHLPLGTQISVFPLQENEGTPDLFPMPLCGSFPLEEATIDDMQQAMSEGSLTAVQLTICYLQRNYQLQSYTNSLLQLNPDVLQIAASLDAERAAGHVRSPLHGIPFTVKDNIATKDNMETTAGSFALLGSIVPRDAHVVSKLREAGAVLFGKATLSEWADMRSSNYSEGYSARGGQARSAYNLTRNPGGSSSGSGIAVGSNAIAFSLGTETDGSVISPAERNAIVGFKPSVGLTSRAGVIPESVHQDTVGTFARTVRDAVYALDAIYGPDPRDNYTSAQGGHTHPNGYTPFLRNRTSLTNATFGIPWTTFWTYATSEQRTTLAHLISLIESAGGTVLNNTELPNASTIISPTGWDWDYGTTRGFPNESEFTVVKVDFYNNIATYLSELNNTNIRSLSDIVRYNNENSGTEGGTPYIEGNGNIAFYSGQDSFLASLESGGVRDEIYYQALHFTQSTCKDAIDYALTAYTRDPLSALLVPSSVGQTYQVAAQAQYPVLTIPMGYHDQEGDHGMPWGLSLMQSMWGEAELVRWGSALEDLVRTEGPEIRLGRRRPRWLGWRERNLPVPF
ncbi:hypothetical protein PMZ80_010173 [Knufia obscura]|uniref:Amidase domain-containing protein n=2 Tax=Knufia TaxID=430999 RepID=A0AAN8EJL3_9EURO|nr:hypothetical protein PMZ80_010173 [Knufia obscura]KAK5952913.1 hypothetical protein OHC33_006034 [Knufia fluminis]